MRILLFTTLFPNAAMQSHGVFVANRIEAFRKHYGAEVKVIAPVPWFPLKADMFGPYGKWAQAPKSEMRGDIEVRHPRYFIPPKTAMSFAPGALTRCLRRAVSELHKEGWDFDFIDAHYLYPDAVAAVRIAGECGKPVVVTARGTDVSLLPEFPGPRRDILDTVDRADAIITVAAALKSALVELGAQSDKVTVLRNGVDLEQFFETDRIAARRALGLDGVVLASVGHLIERKGHDRVIDALPMLPDVTLLIAGDGPEQASLEAQAKRLGVSNRVRFLGRVLHEELKDIYSAADILVLASSREGWPNVLLESMACGTPCVATDVWGSGEVIREKAAGALAADRTADEIAKTIESVLQAPPMRSDVRAYAERHSWKETADGMANIFRDLSEKSAARKAASIRQLNINDKEYRPRLIVTVDTEEKFDWRCFDDIEYSVDDVAGLRRFQAVCERANARPLYFVTTPLLEDEKTARCFAEMRTSNVADFGLHLHQWATSPGKFNGEFFSFQKNLPRSVHREKLIALADSYYDAFGERAIAHRAGRYGIAPEDYALLKGIGIQFDFSPSPAFDFSARGGPDFAVMSNAPFSVESEDGGVFVTPVCGAKAIRRTRIFLDQYKEPPGFRLRNKGVFDNLVSPMRLSPEGTSLADMQTLTRALVKRKTPVLTFSLHSTTLTAGGNVYVPDARSVESLLENTTVFLEWFQNEVGGEVISLDGLKSFYDRQSSESR